MTLRISPPSDFKYFSSMILKTKLVTFTLIALSLVACKGEVAVNSGGDAEAEAPAEEVEEAPVEEVAPEPEAVEEEGDVVVSGDEIKIKKKILFGSGSDEILAESSDLIANIATVMKAHDEIKKVRVQGHTDTNGDAAANLALSERRAKSVVAALVEQGVETKLEAVGKGEEKPLCEEDTDECHQKNRRVQFKVISE